MIHLPKTEEYIISLVITIPLALMTNIHDMKIMSWIGVTFCMITLIYVMLYQVIEVVEYEHRELRWDHVAECQHAYNFIAFVLFAFQNVFLALPIRRQMVEPNVLLYYLISEIRLSGLSSIWFGIIYYDRLGVQYCFSTGGGQRGNSNL